MAVHEIAEAFPEGATTADAIRQKLAAATAYTLADPDDIQLIDFTAVNAVALPRYVIASRTLFEHDPADETSVHDGVTVLVSQDGQRFKSAATPGAFVSVLSIDNDPPVSPAVGDKYIIGVAPTGAWASNAEDLTVYTSAGWVFVAPEIGQRVYVRDENRFYYWSEAGAWTQDVLADASVEAKHLQFPFGMAVESETATPPGGTPAAGTKWIVAASATGAWATWDGDIAEADGAGGFRRLSAYHGATVYDKALNVLRSFEAVSGTWQAGGGRIVGAAFEFVQSGGTTAVGGSGYAFSASTPPTIGDNRTVDSDGAIAYTARHAGAILELDYDVFITANNGGDYTIAVFRDSETNAIAWARHGNTSSPGHYKFHIPAVDALEHTYTVAGVSNSGTANTRPTLGDRRSLSLKEWA